MYKPPVKPRLLAKVFALESYVKKEIPDPKDPNVMLKQSVKEITHHVRIHVSFSCFWIPGLDEESSFDIRYRNASSTDNNKAPWSSKITTIPSLSLDKNVLPNVTYEIQVRARNSAGWSEYSEIANIKTPIISAETINDKKFKDSAAE